MESKEETSYRRSLEMYYTRGPSFSSLEPFPMAMAVQYEPRQVNNNTSLISNFERDTKSSTEAQKPSHGGDVIVLQDTEACADGGTLAWLQVAGSFFLFFNSWGVINSFGVYQTYYETGPLIKGTSPDAISWIGSAQSFLLLVIGVIAGPLYDRGFFKGLICSGTLLITMGFMLTSICKAYWQLMLSQAVCIGLGTGFLFIPSLALIPRYFNKRRAIATGIVTSGSSLGGTIYPLVFQGLQPRIGFAWATRVLGFISLATCGFALLVLRPRGEPSTLRSLVDKDAFKEKSYLLYCVAMFFSYVGFSGPIFYLQPYAMSHGLSHGTLALYLVAILNAASIPGRIVPAYIASKVGPINTMLAAGTACVITGFSWIAVHGAAGNVLFAILYGFVSGGIISMPVVVLASLTEDMSRLGTRMGMSSVLNGFGSLCGTPIAGSILASTGAYLGVQLFCALAIVAMTAFLLALRLYRAGAHRVKV